MYVGNKNYPKLNLFGLTIIYQLPPLSVEAVGEYTCVETLQHAKDFWMSLGSPAKINLFFDTKNLLRLAEN